MECLRIEFTLASPMVMPDTPIMLDSLLAKAAQCERLSAGKEDPNVIVLVDDIIATLPLEREERGDKWVWQASMLEIAPGHGDYRGFIRAARSETFALDLARCQNNRNRDSPVGGLGVRGPTKGCQFAYLSRLTTKARAWCVGNRQEIAYYMQFITHLGKHSRLGCGRISGVEIVPDPQAGTLWKRRVLPWPEPGYRRAMLTTRPPYFYAAAAEEAWLPPKQVFTDLIRQKNTTDEKGGPKNAKLS